MTCDEWKAFFQDYVSGGLSESGRAAIEAHLSDCATCLAEVRAHKMVEDRLRAQPILEAPPGLVDRIIGRVWPVRTTNFKREFVRMAAVFVAAVSLGAAFLFTGLADQVPTAQVEVARQTVEDTVRNITSFFPR